MLQKILEDSISNKCCSFEHSIHQRITKKEKSITFVAIANNTLYTLYAKIHKDIK